MIGAPSLTLRLISNIFVAQLLAMTASWLLASMLMLTTAANFSYDYLSIYAARDLVVSSLEADDKGAIAINRSPALLAEADRTPNFKFAVFRTLPNDAVAGSSPELVEAVRRFANADTRGVDFFISDEAGNKSAASMWQWNTRFGPLFIATSGSTFHWRDLMHFLQNDSPNLGMNLFAITALSGLAAWVAVRRGLAPLRLTAAVADRIDMETLGRGIPVEGVPVEVRPLVDSINSALARLDSAAARMRRYVANAAHELRTPVAILRARIENPEELTFKAELKRDARRLQAIVEQMLIATRLNEKHVTLDHDIDLVSIAKAVVGDCAPLAFMSGRAIEFLSGGGKVVVKGNPQAIECIIVNLVDNALRAERENGVVEVRVEGTTVSVIDHGAGVAAEDRERIFEPFWRKLDSTPGAGLGLAIAKEIMDAHGGRICVNDTPGGGATFKLWFPAAASETHANLNNAYSAPRTNALS